MRSTLLNISGQIDSDTVSVLGTVSRVLTDLRMPYVLVGATARDLVLHYGHGAPIQRATHDVDFAIEVPDWAAFAALRDRLLSQDFQTTRTQHRLISPLDTVVDIVPFGSVEDEQASIAWPPQGDVQMSVLGFREACDSAERVRIQDDPVLDIPVATPAGMALLKIIAWADRDGDLRRKDARDVAYLLDRYEAIPAVRDALYDELHAQIMEEYGWDITLGAAYLLGHHAGDIARPNTREQIVRLANGGAGTLTLSRLAEEMCEHVDIQYARNAALLTAFIGGFGLDLSGYSW